MTRSRLKNKANKLKNPSDIVKFKRQRNLVVNLNKQAKFQYFEKLTVDCNSKSFWKACKLNFSNKIVIYKKILCCMKRINCYQNKKMSVVPTFSKHFGSVRDSLNLFSWPEDLLMSSANDTINCIIKKFAFQGNIKAIKNKMKIKSEFLFNHVYLQGL